jgi:signal peptidase I
LPDTAFSLNARPEYSIRFANDDVWENTSGFNRLNQTVDISSATSNKTLVGQPGDIIVYPNPTDGYLFIKSDRVSGPVSISTLNIPGEMVEKKNMEGLGQPGTEIMIDISDYTSGIYYLTIKQNEGIITKKIIKN